MSDRDPIHIDDFTDIFNGIITECPYKYYILIAFLFLLVTSDIFINRVLAKFENTTYNKQPTLKGTFIQCLILVVSYAIIDILIKKNHI